MPCRRKFCRVGTPHHEYHEAITRINLNLATKIGKHRRAHGCGWYCSFDEVPKKGAARRRNRAWRVYKAVNASPFFLRDWRLKPLTATEAKAILRRLK